MTDCKFKVGETYKDRNGDEYLCISRNDEFGFPLIFRALGGRLAHGTACLRRIHGRINAADGQDSPFDILPNKRKEWVVTYNEGAYAVVSVCTSEYAANDRVLSMVESNARREKCGNRPLFTNIRGPMLWEYEE